MDLLYYYAIGHNNLPSRGYNFSNKWKINYSSDSGDISIESNPNFTTNFFGKNIISLSVMVGANGTGKTTILNTISRTLAYGKNIGPSGDFSFLVVYVQKKCIKTTTIRFLKSVSFLLLVLVELFTVI